MTRTCVMTLGVPVLVMLTACSTYEPRPLDPAAHMQSWGERSPAAEGVAALAQRLGAAAGAPAEFDAADGLSLAEAEVVALFYNARLRSARLRASVAAAGAAKAGLWEDPEFGFDGARIVSGVPDPWIAGGTLGITFPISGRLETEKSLADAEEHAAQERVIAEEWAVRMEVRREWLRWSSIVLRTEELEQLQANLDGVVAVAQRLEEAGEMSRPQARLFRIEQLARRNDRRLLEAAAQEAGIRLRSLMGITPDAPAVLLPSLSLAERPDPERAEVVEARNTALRVLRAEYEVAEQSLRHEVRKQYPDITVGPGFGTEEGDERVLLGVSLPLPLWNRNQRGVAEAEANREAARADYEAAVEDAHAQRAMLRARLSALAEQRREVESVLVPLADEQFADVRRLAELGDFDVLLTLETLVRQHETKLRLIDARLDEALSLVDLAEIMGPATPATGGDTEAEVER